MTNKHTLAPWIVDFQESKPHGMMPVAINNTWNRRVTNQIMGATEDEAAANARLIAAAPELLEIVEELMSSRWLSIDIDRNREKDAIAYRYKATAAIKKAKGE